MSRYPFVCTDIFDDQCLITVILYTCIHTCVVQAVIPFDALIGKLGRIVPRNNLVENEMMRQTHSPTATNIQFLSGKSSISTFNFSYVHLHLNCTIMLYSYVIMISTYPKPIHSCTSGVDIL